MREERGERAAVAGFIRGGEAVAWRARGGVGRRVRLGHGRRGRRGWKPSGARGRAAWAVGPRPSSGAGPAQSATGRERRERAVLGFGLALFEKSFF